MPLKKNVSKLSIFQNTNETLAVTRDPSEYFKTTRSNATRLQNVGSWPCGKDTFRPCLPGKYFTYCTECVFEAVFRKTVHLLLINRLHLERNEFISDLESARLLESVENTVRKPPQAHYHMNLLSVEEPASLHSK